MNINQLKKQIADLEKEILSLQSFISKCPEGTLVVRAAPNGSFRYSVKQHSDDGKAHEIYIPKKDLALAEKHALKDYSLKRLKDAQTEKWLLENRIRLLEKKSHADLYLENHPGAAELILPRLKDNDEFANQWENTPYIRSNRNPKDLKFSTIIPDLFVRSKSEAEIVSSLVKYKVPYRYEEQAVANNIVLHPDFTCLNRRSRQVFYIEHQGKWDDPGYVEDVRWREDQFLKAGIYPWKQLLITTETHDQPFDVQWFHKIIEYYLL